MLEICYINQFFPNFKPVFMPYSFPLGFSIQGAMFLLLIAFVLHILDRQGDFVARTDFIWKAKLKVEQEEVETMRGINKVPIKKKRLLRVHFTIFFSPNFYRYYWKIFYQLMWHSIFCEKIVQTICTMKVIHVWLLCLLAYQITKSFMMRQM